MSREGAWSRAMHPIKALDVLTIEKAFAETMKSLTGENHHCTIKSMNFEGFESEIVIKVQPNREELFKANKDKED